MTLPRAVLHVMNGAGGGAALSTLDLILALRERGIESCVVCHEGGTSAERRALGQATHGAVRYTWLYWWHRKIRVPAWRRPFVEWKQAWRTGLGRFSTGVVAEAARAYGADLIHTNSALLPDGGLAAQRLGLPHVWHLRELLGPGRPYELSWTGPALGEALVSRASVLVANSETTAACVRPWVPADRLHVVPNGIDLRVFGTRPQTPRARVVVGMLAHLTSRMKNHRLFVEAAALVDSALPVEFRIVGHGAEASGDSYVADLVARVRALGLHDRFRFVPFHLKPATVLEELDILAHPTENESFGRVAVEAMAAGLPVVGVRGGGVGEIVDDGTTGLLVPPQDSREFARALERLIRDADLRRAMGAAGRRRAEERFSLPRCVAGILGAYEAAMSRPLGRPQSPRRPARKPAEDHETGVAS